MRPVGPCHLRQFLRQIIHKLPCQFLVNIHPWMSGAAFVTFDHASGGLASKDGKPIAGFSIAGPDLAFHPAKAEIEGNAVIVKSDSVLKPAAVRYAWSNTAAPNLMNAEGLPAWPFGTDGR
jgi:hypothetical protein